jgi:hypothetical protein
LELDNQGGVIRSLSDSYEEYEKKLVFEMPQDYQSKLQSIVNNFAIDNDAAPPLQNNLLPLRKIRSGGLFEAIQIRRQRAG